MYRALVVVSIFCIVFLCAFGAEYDYTVSVNAGQYNCYFVPIDQPSHVSMETDFQVLDGGDRDITFYLKDPKGNVLAADIRKSDNYHTLNITDKMGDYEFCFDNSFTYSSAKIVFFEVILYDKDGSSDETKYLDLANASEIVKDSIEIVRVFFVRSLFIDDSRVGKIIRKGINISD